jgi:hypothetical protein
MPPMNYYYVVLGLLAERLLPPSGHALCRTAATHYAAHVPPFNDSLLPANIRQEKCLKLADNNISRGSPQLCYSYPLIHRSNGEDYR